MSFSSSGFPGTPAGYYTGYPLSAATGGPADTGVCCVDDKPQGYCSGVGRHCTAHVDGHRRLGVCQAGGSCPADGVCCVNGITGGSCQGVGRDCFTVVDGHHTAGVCLSHDDCPPQQNGSSSAGTDLVFHNCYTGTLQLVSTNGKTLGNVRGGATITVKAGTYVAGQPFLLYDGSKAVSGTYHAPTPSSASSLDIYFRTDGSVSTLSCNSLFGGDLWQWVLPVGGVTILLLVLFLVFWR